MILGISGKARSGKDSLYSFAKKDGWIRISFADDLKRRLAIDFGLTKAYIEGELKETPVALLNGHTPREAMIDLGNLYRKYYPNFWVDTALEQIENSDYSYSCLHNGDEANFMITDVRFPNEAKAIKDVGGYIVRLERHPSRDSQVSEQTKTNLSETALDEYLGFDFRLLPEQNENMEQLKEFWNEVKETLYDGVEK